MKCNLFPFFLLFVVGRGDFGSGSGSKFNCAARVGRVGSDDLGYGPGSGFSFEPVQTSSLRWFELCDMVHYPAGSIHQKMVHCSHKGKDMVSNNTQVGCGVKTMLNWYEETQSVPRKYPPHHYTTTWTDETRQDGSMLSCSLHQIMTLPSECSRNQDSSDQATFFQSSIVQFWWFCVNCILCFLFLADRSGTRCGLLLLEPICFRVRRVVCSEMVFCIPWL